MSITRIFLLINAIGWALFGFYAFFNPETLRTTILGANTISSDGVSELMAIYGGTCLGAATLFLSAFSNLIWNARPFILSSLTWAALLSRAFSQVSWLVFRLQNS